MKVKIVRGVYVDGKACKEGDVVDTKKAGLLIGSGAAIKITEEDQPQRKSAPVNRKAEKLNEK